MTTTGAQRGEPDQGQGRCGRMSPVFLGSPPELCCVPAGHEGWHRSDQGAEWNDLRPAPGAEPGAWIAYYPDWSGMALFCDELAALRYGVEHQMQVKFVRHGEEIR